MCGHVWTVSKDGKRTVHDVTCMRHPEGAGTRAMPKETGRRPCENDGPWCQPKMLAKATPRKSLHKRMFSLKTVNTGRISRSALESFRLTQTDTLVLPAPISPDEMDPTAGHGRECTIPE